MKITHLFLLSLFAGFTATLLTKVLFKGRSMQEQMMINAGVVAVLLLIVFVLYGWYRSKKGK
jgi:low affinity Fe/Cu permease